MADPAPRRRRRLRHDPTTGQPRRVEPDREPAEAPAPPPAPPPAPVAPSPAVMAALTSPVHDPEDDEPARGEAVETAREEAARAEDREAERGLRGLVGGGSSQVNVAAAMRARDATRPTEEDLTRADRSLTIIRRGWTPPAGR